MAIEASEGVSGVYRTACATANDAAEAPWFAADELDDADAAFVIETVDELELGPVADERWVDEAEAEDAARAPDAPDAFDLLIRAMEGAAYAMGAPPAASHQLRALLGLERIESSLFAEGTRSALIAAGLAATSATGTISRSAALTAQAGAWRDILRGTSEDYERCGGVTLDVWAAGIVACVAADRTRCEPARRELRGRGVAAFGIVAAA
jgi:hypothetical protein